MTRPAVCSPESLSDESNVIDRPRGRFVREPPTPAFSGLRSAAPTWFIINNLDCTEGPKAGLEVQPNATKLMLVRACSPVTSSIGPLGFVLCDWCYSSLRAYCRFLACGGIPPMRIRRSLPVARGGSLIRQAPGKEHDHVAALRRIAAHGSPIQHGEHSCHINLHQPHPRVRNCLRSRHSPVTTRL